MFSENLLPSVEDIKSTFVYDNDTGFLWFAAPGQRRDMTKPAGSINKTDGVVRVMINNKIYRAERIIWKMMTGEDGANVAHINGNKSDNRWSNLMRVGPKRIS